MGDSIVGAASSSMVATVMAYAVSTPQRRTAALALGLHKLAAVVVALAGERDGAPGCELCGDPNLQDRLHFTSVRY